MGNGQNFYNVASLNVSGGALTFQNSTACEWAPPSVPIVARAELQRNPKRWCGNVANDFELGGNSGTYSAVYNLSGGTLSTTVNVNLGAYATSGDRRLLH